MHCPIQKKLQKTKWYQPDQRYPLYGLLLTQKPLFLLLYTPAVTSSMNNSPGLHGSQNRLTSQIHASLLYRSFCKYFRVSINSRDACSLILNKELIGVPDKIFSFLISSFSS